MGEGRAFSFRDLGKNWDNFGLCLMGMGGNGRGKGGRGEEKAISSCTCANVGSAVEMGKLFLYPI